jgi:hypothetical protein
LRDGSGRRNARGDLRRLLDRWKLPKQIKEAVAHHHSPGQADRGELHLAHVIEAADHYINAAGFGMPPYSHHPEASFENSHQRFGLKDRILKISESFKAEFEAVRTFF